MTRRGDGCKAGGGEGVGSGRLRAHVENGSSRCKCVGQASGGGKAHGSCKGIGGARCRGGAGVRQQIRKRECGRHGGVRSCGAEAVQVGLQLLYHLCSRGALRGVLVPRPRDQRLQVGRAHPQVGARGVLGDLRGAGEEGRGRVGEGGLPLGCTRRRARGTAKQSTPPRAPLPRPRPPAPAPCMHTPTPA